MYYPEELIEEVRTRNDIVEVISGYVRLQKKGSNYFGLCPFHNEKSPSFSVSPGKQMYYCFGCGAGGNVITFLMEYENQTFPEAVRTLAQRAGIALPEADDSKEARQADSRRAKLLEINKEAAKYFYYQLRTERGSVGMEYLRKRELSDETMNHFGLGYANKYSNDLIQYLKSKGYSEDLIRDAGLCNVDEKHGMYDKFWNRVMFPIQDINHRVIGFGGRVMGDGKPKYLNSPETEIFDKSRNLYGLNFARTSRKGNVILCEGYMDVIALHEYGYPCAVASMGTSLTAGQARMLKRYTDEIYICYDGDSAGRGATLRGLDILRAEGLRVNVMSLPDKTDPDEFIREHGAEAFSELVRGARELNDYKLYVLMSKYDLSEQNPSERERNRIAFTKEALDVIRSTEDSVEKEKLVEKVVFTTGFNEEFVRNNSVREENESFVIPQAGADGYTLALACVAAAMIEGVEYAEDYYPAVKAESSAGKIFSYIKECRERSEKPEMNRLFQETGEADPLVMAIVGTEFDGKPSEKAYYTDCLKKVKSADIDGEIMQLSKYAEKASEDELPAYTARIRALMNKKKNISGSR